MRPSNSTLLTSFALCLVVTQSVGGAPTGENVNSADELRKLASEERHELLKGLKLPYVRGYGDMKGPAKYRKVERIADEVCDLSLKVWGEEMTEPDKTKHWQNLNGDRELDGLPTTVLDFDFTGAKDSKACPPGAPCTGSRDVTGDQWIVKSETNKQELIFHVMGVYIFVQRQWADPKPDENLGYKVLGWPFLRSPLHDHLLKEQQQQQQQRR